MTLGLDSPGRAVENGIASVLLAARRVSTRPSDPWVGRPAATRFPRPWSVNGQCSRLVDPRPSAFLAVRGYLGALSIDCFTSSLTPVATRRSLVNRDDNRSHLSLGEYCLGDSAPPRGLIEAPEMLRAAVRPRRPSRSLCGVKRALSRSKVASYRSRADPEGFRVAASSLHPLHACILVIDITGHFRHHTREHGSQPVPGACRLHGVGKGYEPP